MKSYRLLPLTMLLPALISGCSPAESSVQVATIRPVKLFEVLNVEDGDFRTFPARVAANRRAGRVAPPDKARRREPRPVNGYRTGAAGSASDSSNRMRE